MDSQRMETIIDALEARCLEWLGVDDDGNCVLVDPHEGEPIAAHYGMTHLAAALLLRHPFGSAGYQQGLSLCEGVLNRWPKDSKTPGYHNDFNNMALCMIEEKLASEEIEPKLRARIRATILETPDSDNPTVNWLPMRVYVNTRRQSWGRDCGAAVGKAEAAIGRSWNNDGFVEDRIPKGISFNLQYDAATVAVLEFLNRRGKAYDLDKAMVALINALGPDGDINYLGRGCNQIFAWGLWLYLLKSRGQRCAFESSLAFLEQRIFRAIEHDNVLLNDFPGSEKDFWWDYHYASVYFPHLLLWLGECQRLPERWTEDVSPSPRYGQDSGVDVVRNERFFLCTFSGRKEYLAERGPMVVELLLPNGKPLVKASFGPYLKKFGEKQASVGVLLNHFGVVRIDGFRGPAARPQWSFRSWRAVEPSTLELAFDDGAGETLITIPLLSPDERERFTVYADGRKLPLREIGVVKSPFGYATVLQSQSSHTKNWCVEVRL